MKRIPILVLVLVTGCAGQNPLANINSGTCAQIGGILGLLMSSAQIAPVAGTSMGAAACDAVAGLFKTPNTMSGTVEMPVQMSNVKLTVAGPQDFQCPANYTCTPK